ncbi:hypothetical protein MSAN_00846500 [Mycena sanguinolenta]|uniref:DUF6534 domain-containing protein n=1 Tax=Mycena sanguinolenta TaxID=230812 RepID=A0A8H6Z0V9_9AGAR|nr:hypothetical protein MSAN_00846500 [Mycena sanguinolenta]
MSAPSFDANGTLGALLIGTLVSYMLFGVATIQGYNYYVRFPDDSRKIKALVTAVWFGELGHVICIGHSLYAMVITEYGHPERLARLPNSLFCCDFLGRFDLLTCTAVQSFFAFRIYALLKSLWLPRIGLWLLCICWAMSLFRVLPGSIVLFAYGINEPIAKLEGDWAWLFDSVWTVSAANDLLIAGALVFVLYRQRARVLKNTVAIVDKLIAWTIETGVVTSMASLIMLAVFLSLPATFSFLAIFVIVSRLYSISLFASLNSRATLRTQQEEITLPTLPTTINTTLARPPNVTGSVEMNKVIGTPYDW